MISTNPGLQDLYQQFFGTRIYFFIARRTWNASKTWKLPFKLQIVRFRALVNGWSEQSGMHSDMQVVERNGKIGKEGRNDSESESKGKTDVDGKVTENRTAMEKYGKDGRKQKGKYGT